jgi:hypothetical protein
MYVFWTDNRSCSHDDVFVQRITASGAVAPGWPEAGMPLYVTTAGQGSALAVSDSAGGAIVVWRDGRTGTAHNYAQRIAPDGAKLWGSNDARVDDVDGDASGVEVVGDGAGGIFVAWPDTRRGLNDGPPHYHPQFDLYAQHFDAGGTRLWAATGDPVLTNADFYGNVTLVPDGLGGVLITWFDRRGPSYLQHFDASGAPHLQPDGIPVAGRFLGFAASDGAGGIVSVFTYGPDTQEDLYAQRVDSIGTIEWPLNGVLVASAPYGQQVNDILPDGNGGAFIAWYDLRNGQDWDIYLQRITASGSAAPGWPTNGLAVCTAGGFQIYPRLISEGAGGCVVTWYDARSAASGYDIYAQRIGGDATIAPGWPAGGARLSGAAGDQIYPLPVADGTGGELVAWSDYRVYADVYAQRVSGAGVVGETLWSVAVDPPDRASFALGRAFPNPLKTDRLFVPVSLPPGPVGELSLFDIGGRRLAWKIIPPGTSGPLTIELRVPDRATSGVYLIRLAQAGRAVSRLVSILK